MAEFIYGHWAVMETLRAGKRNVEQLLIGENIEEKGMIAEIINLAKGKGVLQFALHSGYAFQQIRLNLSQDNTRIARVS